VNILIAGGSGILGRALIETLLERGHAVSAFAYNARDFDSMENHPNLSVFGCDVTKRESLRGACDGIALVISCIGITRLSSKLTHMDVDYQGNLNLLREAERAGVT